MTSKICILDDNPAFLQDMQSALANSYMVTAFPDALSFRASFTPRAFELVVLDMRLAGAKEGLEVLREIHQIDPYQAVVVATAYADTETYLETLQAGALLYVDKTRHTPATMALLFDAIIQQGRLRREQASTYRTIERMDPTEIVGSSESIRTLRSQIEKTSNRTARFILIEGESGSGRELVARNIHARRAKGSAPPLSVLPAQNMPSADIIRQLFGQYTNAGYLRGLLEEAHGSGLVVRCADDLSSNVLDLLIEAQTTGSFKPIASKSAHPFDAAIYLTCEASEPLQSIIKGLDIEFIHIPPLRDRKDDIPQLASYLLEAQRKRGREGSRILDSGAISSLMSYNWPGNVAELRIVLEYGALRAMIEGSQTILQEHLPLTITNHSCPDDTRRWDIDYQESISQVALVESAIEKLNTTNKTKLAMFLHMRTPTTLSRRIERALNRYPEFYENFPMSARTFGRTAIQQSRTYE